jgi:hypothetical protein
VLAGILAGGLLGALLLLVAEFTVLFEVHVASTPVPLKSVTAGSHHSYALVPIALVAAALAFGVWRAGSRPALLAIAVMGVIGLLITLLGDLPDAHAKGLVGSSTTHFVDASSSPKAGFYMETLGAAMLVITSVSGFILLGPPTPAPRRRRREASGGAEAPGPGDAPGSADAS